MEALPWSRLRPRLLLDSQRTVDGWHRRWDTQEPWALNRDLWLQVEMARADCRDDATVLWVKGHSLPGAAGRSKNEALRIFGNKAADALDSASEMADAVRMAEHAVQITDGAGEKVDEAIASATRARKAADRAVHAAERAIEVPAVRRRNLRGTSEVPKPIL